MRSRITELKADDRIRQRLGGSCRIDASNALTVPISPVSLDGEVELTCDGTICNPNHRYSTVAEADGDARDRETGSEVGRAVHGVDDPSRPISQWRDFACADVLLPDDGVGRKRCAYALSDDLLVQYVDGGGKISRGRFRGYAKVMLRSVTVNGAAGVAVTLHILTSFQNEPNSHLQLLAITTSICAELRWDRESGVGDCCMVAVPLRICGGA
mmetsp:Transcript_18627/g.37741  ORF Transcript_18627/g.37741 Transcript_18627/m.37741 type:complete len:213 (-) Transcript_18627:144-782(-)